MTQEIQIPAQMVQQLLGGPKPATKPPDVVEVMAYGARLAFNVDAVELVQESVDGTSCAIRLKEWKELIEIEMSYDDFLAAIDVKPRVLKHGSSDSGC